ncbi:MAG TPA: serine/threonine-protein kinase, partial [Rugosimonospora sp.]|nr:serine/threonine-protein kinase [Rugosimonospora sp.]
MEVVNTAAPGPEPTLAAADLALGEGVEVLGELGRGAHTAVYRIRRDGVEYALKVLRRFGPADEAVLVEFRREAALLARLNHPGVPKVYDAGLAGGHPCLVLELIAGQPLSERLAAGPLDTGALVRLGLDVAAALHAAHRAGLVHRDIKPANIVLTGTGRARLIDFGLAAAGRGGTTGDAVVGTFDYAAPEQTGMLARPVDGRADLYALGVVLYRAATGQLPFRADDVGELLALHAAAPVPDPRALRPELPAELAGLVRRLLAKDPDDRVQTARGLYAALSHLAGSPPPAELPAGGFLVGREEEQARLAQHWLRARTGHGGVVLV